MNKSLKKLFLAIVIMISIGMTGCAQMKTLTRHIFVKSDAQKPELAGSTLVVETNASQAKAPETEETQVETEAAPDDKKADDKEEASESETEAKETEKAADSGEVTYQDVDEVVYTSDSVNARNAPGPDGEVAKTVPAGTKMRRIGIGSDGWDKVDLNGELYYMSHDYLTTTAP